MRITESRLRRIIRSVIAESLENESLKSDMLKIIDDLRETLKDCRSPRDCAVKINHATGRMADAWDMAGGSNVGFFVKACPVGVMMNQMQTSALEGKMIDFQSFLSEVETEINKCDFSDLRL